MKWLRKNLSVDVSAANVTSVSVMRLAGDANNDNSVDQADFAILVSGYEARADFNDDGSVDATDFGLLVGNYNTIRAP